MSASGASNIEKCPPSPSAPSNAAAPAAARRERQFSIGFSMDVALGCQADLTLRRRASLRSARGGEGMEAEPPIVLEAASQTKRMCVRNRSVGGADASPPIPHRSAIRLRQDKFYARILRAAPIAKPRRHMKVRRNLRFVREKLVVARGDADAQT